MPDGVVQWFDTSTGEGRIVRGGRHYAVRAEDMDPKARVPGARVHFDCRRGDADRAVDVTLRAGSRVDWHHRRFGDLSGSHAPDVAGGRPSSTRHTELGRRLDRSPLRVASAWVALLAAGDLENLVRLYAPDASLHADGEVLVGPREIRRYWSASPLLGGATPDFAGDADGSVVIEWSAEADGPATSSRMWVAHGEIAEQRLDATAEIRVRGPGSGETPIVMSASGDVTDEEWDTAIDKVGKVLDVCGAPVPYVSVRLERAADPARERGAMARATIDLDGEPVRAHVSATTMLDAIDRLEERLRDRLRHLADHRRALRRRGADRQPGTWRHGDRGTPRGPVFPRPVGEREVVRHTTFAPAMSTVDEAVFDLESMDYDFFLFGDLSSGQDAVVWRDGDGYRLRLSEGPGEVEREPCVAQVEIDPVGAPTLTVTEARDVLDRGSDAWVFFRDAAAERGRLLYRRYDGHYGLITPIGDQG